MLPTTIVSSSSLPSHRQRRSNAPSIAPSTNTTAGIKGRPPQSHQQYPPDDGCPRRRRRRGKKLRRATSSWIPSERVLGSMGIVLGILLLVAISILVHTIVLLKSRPPFSNLPFKSLFSFAASTRNISRHHDPWNPELQFRHKVHHQPRPRPRHHPANDNESTTTASPPIFVVGLPKAGTSSLFAYFDCLGFYSQHWYCCGPQHHAQQEDMTAYVSDCMVSNLQDQLPILDGCGDYEVYTELNGPRRKTKADEDFVGGDGIIGYRPRIFLPQRYHLQELHDYAPRATWILNARPVEDWVRSVSQVPAKMLTKQLLNEAQFQDPERWVQEPNQWHPIRHPYRPTKAFLEEFWQDHIQYVTDFVAAHPSHNLIWVNITDPNAGVHLAQDLVSRGGITNFPVLLHNDRGGRKNGNLKPSHISTEEQEDSSNSVSIRLHSRAKACWGAHNVNQHGGD